MIDPRIIRLIRLMELHRPTIPEVDDAPEQAPSIDPGTMARFRTGLLPESDLNPQAPVRPEPFVRQLRGYQAPSQGLVANPEPQTPYKPAYPQGPVRIPTGWGNGAWDKGGRLIKYFRGW